MAITEFQRKLCRLIARNRIDSGVSYVAGAAALNTLIGSPRLSSDVDVFHDRSDAVSASWEQDRAVMEASGYAVQLVRERDGFVEATVSEGTESVVFQWVTDSAYRFFPLVEHDDFGLTLHPFDLATNKVLALVGRLEARDWIDTLRCHSAIQPLGYLAWAACGKDPGFSPSAILAQAARSTRYSRTEIEALSFSGPPPDAAELSRSWHAMLDQARRIVEILPAEEVGKCVIDPEGSLITDGPEELSTRLDSSRTRFHEGSLHGALPGIASG
jgi:hypothetical protein